MHHIIRALPWLGLVGMAMGCSGPTSAATERTLPEPKQKGIVQIHEASRQFIGVEAVGVSTTGALLRAPGRVVFRDGALSQLGAPLAGRVVQVHVRSGDLVKPGDALVTLDCPEAATARTAVATAMVSLREARLALDRERRMLAQGVGIDREKLAAETKVAELEAELARARSGAAFVGEGQGTTVVLRAPLAGSIVGLRATVGMTVQQGEDSIVEVGDRSALWIVADVFERDLPMIREDAPAIVELPSVNRALTGRVSSIGAVVANGVRAVPVKISLDHDAELLRPGMYGRVEIQSPASGLSLPAEAVLIDGKESIVYVEKDPLTFVRRPVTVAQSVAGKVEVVAGIAAGEHVVVRGALLLDGAADQLL